MRQIRSFDRWILRIVSLAVLGMGGAIVTGCEDHSVSPRWRFQAQEPVDETVGVTTQTEFILQGISGTVDIRGGDDASTIVITGFRRVRSHSQADADERLEDLEVVVSSSERIIRVETAQPDETEGREYVVDYTIVLPARLDVTAGNVNGVITVEDVSGQVAANGVNGDVEGRRLAGDAILATVNGRVIADTAISPGATFRLRSINGDVRLTIPTETSAWVSASLSNGRIRHRNLEFVELTATDRSLSGCLGAGEGSVELRTTNGDIDLTGR